MPAGNRCNHGLQRMDHARRYRPDLRLSPGRPHRPYLRIDRRRLRHSRSRQLWSGGDDGADRQQSDRPLSTPHFRSFDEPRDRILRRPPLRCFGRPDQPERHRHSRSDRHDADISGAGRDVPGWPGRCDDLAGSPPVSDRAADRSAAGALGQLSQPPRAHDLARTGRGERPPDRCDAGGNAGHRRGESLHHGGSAGAKDRRHGVARRGAGQQDRQRHRTARSDHRDFGRLRRSPASSPMPATRRW